MSKKMKLKIDPVTEITGFTKTPNKETIRIDLEPGHIAIICKNEKEFQNIQEAMIIADDCEATEYYVPFIKNVSIVKNLKK
jgi:hypothetical protein